MKVFLEEANRIVVGLRWHKLLGLLFAGACAAGGWHGLARLACAEVVAHEPFDYPNGELEKAQGGVGWEAGEGWKTTQGNTQYLCNDDLTYTITDKIGLGRPRAVAIHGQGQRNNPLRRQLAAPYTGDELFVRFLLRYDAASIDDAGQHGDGEFFVLWLDDLDGGDGADHNLNVPSIGLSVRTQRGKPVGDKKNYFMVRIGVESTAFSPVELQGDRTYLLLARLAKTRPGPLGLFDRLELWVDPAPGDLQRQPDAVAHGRGSNAVSWIGFSTGKRTEASDLIFIDELALGRRWSDVVPGGEIAEKVAAGRDARNVVVAPAENVDFRRDVFPILRDRCFACHQGADAESGHRLDRRDEIVGLNQGRPLAILKDSKNSPLYQALIVGDEDTRMPQGDDPLPDEEIAVLRAWIDQGLTWDESLLPTKPAQSDHAMFQPVRRPEVPRTEGSVPRVRGSGFRVQESGVRVQDQTPNHQTPDTRHQNPIDAFIAAKHQELGLSLAPPVNRRTLLRRVTLDLTGLPPTPEAIEAFLADESPDAYRKVIDRLLSSTAYGERWGRHWLDVARWAESDGYQQNWKRPTAWRYRDYVVRAFAENKPYDEFLRQQIAGDELTPCTDENLIATGFLAAARYSGNELDKAIQRHDILIDITNTTSSAVLGLTMQCAQCHNHKFDPITARDYYQFLGFFISGQPLDLLLREGVDAPMKLEDEAALVAAGEEQDEMLASARARLEANQRKQGISIAVSQPAVIGSLPAEQKKRFAEIKQQFAKYERTWGFYSPTTSPHRLPIPYLQKSMPLPYAPHLLERLKPVLLYRGDLDSPGPEVGIGWPAVFGSAAGEKIAQPPRTSLVDWLTDRDNPLTARVGVNRLWLYHFGQGLVSTPNDFGTQGAEPTHPELLDWLAAELMDSGWDTGHIQRLILRSNTYRQSSQFSEACNDIDPENRYYWRWLPRRLEAEAIRDSMLAVSGLLDRTVGGLSVPLTQRDASTRRTIYLEQKRGELPQVQQLFDAPSALVCCGRRRNSTVPLQPLFLLNNPETLRYAEALAKRVVDEAGRDVNRQLDRAFELVLGRLPCDSERQTLLAFLSDQAEEVALVQLCQGLMNLNEFLYIP